MNTYESEPETVEAVLQLALVKGFKVFPVHTCTNGTCSCMNPSSLAASSRVLAEYSKSIVPPECAKCLRGVSPHFQRLLSRPRPGGDLRRISYESHEVTYCPACQTDGRVLADRRMSRLVR